MSKFNMLSGGDIIVQPKTKRAIAPKSTWKSRSWTLQFPAHARIKGIEYIEWERGDMHWRVTPINMRVGQKIDIHSDGNAFRPQVGDRLYPSYGNYLRGTVMEVTGVDSLETVMLTRSTL